LNLQKQKSKNAFSYKVKNVHIIYIFFSNLIKFFLRLGTKVALVGTAVYVTVDNSVWDKSEYAKGAISKVKSSLPETTDLLKDVRLSTIYVS